MTARGQSPSFQLDSSLKVSVIDKKLKISGLLCKHHVKESGIVCVHVYVCRYTCIYVHVHVCIYVCTHIVCICKYLYVCIYVHMCSCMCVYQSLPLLRSSLSRLTDQFPPLCISYFSPKEKEYYITTDIYCAQPEEK